MLKVIMGVIKLKVILMGVTKLSFVMLSVNMLKLLCRMSLSCVILLNDVM